MASKYDPGKRGRVVRLFGKRRSEVPEESATASFRHLHDSLGRHRYPAGLSEAPKWMPPSLGVTFSEHYKH